MSHHSFVDDIPQEAEMEEIENNDIKSYFISTSDTYIYAQDRASGSSNTYTAVYFYKDIRRFYPYISSPQYQYNLVISERLRNILS
jgi:hypothetical protein